MLNILFNFKRLASRLMSVVSIMVILLTACDLISSTLVETPLPPTVSNPTQLATDSTLETPQEPQAPSSEETFDVYLPEVSAPEDATVEVQIQSTSTTPPIGPFAILSYLENGDLWLAEVPVVNPRQLTQSGDIISYAWSPDGLRLATFNGRSICMVYPNEDRTGDCFDLGLDENQALVERRLVWSPDQQVIVLWNPVNPWDEGAIGWLIVDLNRKQVQFRIDDPVDWGVGLAPDNDPGGITGQPIFLPNGALIGTITHRWLCGSGGCHYQLYQFDPLTRSFTPFPNKPDEGWSEGQRLVLSPDNSMIANYGTFHAGCDSYVTFVDLFNLTDGNRKIFNLDMEAISSLDLSPNASSAIIARVAGCSSEAATNWDRVCGLSTGFDIFPMQLWDLSMDQRVDLVPGTSPDWSPDGNWIVFRSCLAGNADGSWEPSPNNPPVIYVMDPTTKTVYPVAEGSSPAWKP